MLNEPQCSLRRCKHFVGVKQDEDGEASERVVCAAFPDRIPDEISYGANLHLTPLPDQGNTIVFEAEATALGLDQRIAAAVREGLAGLSEALQ